MLEDTSGTIHAFSLTLNKVLAYWSQVLLVQILFPLEFVRTVCKATPLLLVLVFADKTTEPEATELSLNFTFPIFWFNTGDKLFWAFLCFCWLLSLKVWLGQAHIKRSLRRSRRSRGKLISIIRSTFSVSNFSRSCEFSRDETWNFNRIGEFENCITRCFLSWLNMRVGFTARIDELS